MISDPEGMREAWREWVSANLGRDPHRVGVAAEAGAGAAMRGSGFEAAVAAARDAWRAAGPARTVMIPRALVVAMWIATGGCVASTLLALGLWIAFGAYIGPFAGGFFAYNLFFAGLNWYLLSAMRKRSHTAWVAALSLVVIGIAFDVVEQAGMWSAAVSTTLPDYAVPASLIALGVGIPLTLLGVDESQAGALATSWLLVHLAFIQLPILAGLLAGRTWTALPAAAASGSGGILDAVS